jgi:hypothetical protein
MPGEYASPPSPVANKGDTTAYSPHGKSTERSAVVVKVAIRFTVDVDEYRSSLIASYMDSGPAHWRDASREEVRSFYETHGRSGGDLILDDLDRRARDRARSSTISPR